MDTTRVDICYRPLRIAWAIQSDDFELFRQASYRPLDQRLYCDRKAPPSFLRIPVETDCMAGLRGLELANVIFRKLLKYWANSLWFAEHCGT